MIAAYLSRRLQISLSKLGLYIGHCPWPFLAVPLIISFGLAYAVVQADRISTAHNALQLYIPNVGLSKIGRENVVTTFGDIWQSELDPINGVSFALIVKAKDGGDILNADFMQEYVKLRNKLEDLDVQGARYSHMCYQNRLLPGTCLPDLVATVTNLRGIHGYRDIRLMKYPLTTVPPTNIQVQVPLGGVNTTSLGFIRHAKAIHMMFTFSYQFFEVAQIWQTKMLRVVDEFDSDIVKISQFTLMQFQDDLNSISVSLQTLVPLLLLVVAVFCVIACCVVDWVHSKPLLALAGVGSALMAIITGFGICILYGVPTVDIVYVAPFLMLSVGVDDMFLLLASWRKTSVPKGVPSRMAETFGDAAVSITITSLTDVLSFAIGASTVFPAVRHFCAYTAVSMLFTYIYTITLFGAVLALTGRREEQRRHSVFVCIRMGTSMEAEKAGRSLLYKMCCTGGDAINADDALYATSTSGHNMCLPIAPNDNIFNLFFTRYYAPLLRIRWIQWAAAFSYIGYLCMAVYGATCVQIGMNYAQLLPDGSETALYLADYGEYFAKDISPPMEIVLPPMDMSRLSSQQLSLDIVHEFENSLFTAAADYWLLDFLPYREQSGGDFYFALNEYITSRAQYTPHVKLDPLRRLVTSRVLIHTRNLAFGQERMFVSYLKEVLSLPFMANVTVYHSSLQLGEQQSAVLPAMVKTVGTATLVMLLISFLLIPRAACSLCLAACIISTNLGVLGAMSLWGVRLDIISMITVLMSVGISVDFVAHVSFYYVQAMQNDVPLSQAQRALRHLGLPIMQGALSTTCGMCVLLVIDAYMVRAFVKTLMLVVIFGLYHGLLLLPIVLSLFLRDSISGTSSPPTSKSTVTPVESGRWPPQEPKIPRPQTVTRQPGMPSRDNHFKMFQSSNF